MEEAGTCRGSDPDERGTTMTMPPKTRSGWVILADTRAAPAASTAGAARATVKATTREAPTAESDQMTRDDDPFDDFLNEVTHVVHAAWTDAGGRALTSEELHQLNDLLTAFFADRR
jgi:hypothetical protein